MLYYQYTQFIDDLKILISKIDFEFESIIAISRGGLTIAHFLAIQYNIRNIKIISSSHYDDKKILDTVELGEIPELKISKNYLIIDDLVDTGESMYKILHTLKTKYPSNEFRVATLFAKESSSIAPDFYVRKSTEWIEFFWENPLHSPK